MIVSFCGHGKVYQQEKVSARLDEAIACLISEGASKFLLGGYGDFDLLAQKPSTEQKNVLYCSAKEFKYKIPDKRFFA